jgi:hypothetical protein
MTQFYASYPVKSTHACLEVSNSPVIPVYACLEVSNSPVIPVCFNYGITTHDVQQTRVTMPSAQ